MLKAIETEKVNLHIKSKLILIIDDDMICGDAFASFINEKKEYFCEHVGTIEKAKEKIMHCFYDYIILDGMNGKCINLLEWLHVANKPQIENIIAFTGDLMLARSMELCGVRLDSDKEIDRVLKIIGFREETL